MKRATIEIALFGPRGENTFVSFFSFFRLSWTASIGVQFGISQHIRTIVTTFINPYHQ